MTFDIVTLEQGTPDWLAWRQGGIGASEADAIMGRNPWKSPAAVLKEKLSPVRTGVGNAAMARGNALEPRARSLYVERSGVTVAPACLQSRTTPWLRASVDGICLDTGQLVEIKCGERVYEKSASGSVPAYYMGQLQHILAVTGFARIDFWCWLPDRTPQLITVARDEAFIARMLEAEAHFWAQVENARRG